MTGHAPEAEFWKAVRQKTGIVGDDEELRDEILSRFVLRQEMIDLVSRLRRDGYALAILSDQTNWLDEIDRKTPVFPYFDHVFNSYHLQRSKKDPSTFHHVCDAMGFSPEEVLFIDDNPENARRAEEAGLGAIVFENYRRFMEEINRLVPLSE